MYLAIMFLAKLAANARGLDGQHMYKWRKFYHIIASHFHEARVQFVQYIAERGSPSRLAGPAHPINI